MTVTAREVVEHRFDPSVYPFQHLAVMQVGKIGVSEGQVPLVMSAVETLGRVGWELVSLAIVHRTVIAAMRRR